MTSYAAEASKALPDVMQRRRVTQDAPGLESFPYSELRRPINLPDKSNDTRRGATLSLRRKPMNRISLRSSC